MRKILKWEDNKLPVKIGRMGENEYTQVVMDCSVVFSEFPSAIPAVTIQPPSGDAYPTIATRDGDNVVWVVNDSDLALQGFGEMQVTFTSDNVVVKSCIWRTIISKSLIPTGEAPTPVEDWLVEANTALNAIPQTIDDALQEAKDSGEFDGDPGQDGFSPVITVTDITGGHRVTITDATGSQTVDVMDGEPGEPGEPGSDGVSPTVAVSPITDGHRVTITDKTGEHSFDVMDGEKGDPGDPGDPTELIDDSSTAANKAWSASKTAGEVSDLKTAFDYALDITRVDNANFTVGRAGKYVNSEGGISSYNAYNISTPIAVSKGDAISVHYTANSSIAVVSYCDENGEIDSVVETGKGRDKDYSFISSVDGYICVSYDNTRSAYYSFIHYGFISDTNTHLSELDSSVLNLGNSVSNIDADQLKFIDNTISNNLFNPVTLNIGTVIGNDGIPVGLSYCSHTDYIAVTPNDVVRCTPYYLNNETSVILYNSSKEYVQHTRWIQTVSDGVLSFTVPSGVAYMVLNVYNKHIPDIVVVKNIAYDADLAGSYGQSIKLKGCKYESALFGKKIAYNGDSICNSRITSDSGANGGAYAHKIALATGSSYENRAAPGGILASAAPGGQTSNRYVVSDVTNMADDADLICFEGGINDYWKNVPLGNYSESDYSSNLDTTTICGALESIFRQATAKWVGKPIVFVITHKIKNTVYVQNMAGYTWTDVHEKMVGICKKYAIPYYDAFENSGLNAYNDVQNTNFLTSNESGTPDGCHPNSAGYDKYYVPQLIALFESVMPKS